MSSEINKYTCTEQLHLTAKLTKGLEDFYLSSYAISGPIGSRIAGVVLIPLSVLAETFAHLGLACGKTLVGLPVSCYNFIAKPLYAERAIPNNWEFSSGLVNLMLATESIMNLPTLTFTFLLNPSRANAWMNKRNNYGPELPNVSPPAVSNETPHDELQTARANYHLKVVELNSMKNDRDRLNESHNKLKSEMETKQNEVDKLNAKLNESAQINVRSEISEEAYQVKSREFKELESKLNEVEIAKANVEALKANVEALKVQVDLEVELLRKDVLEKEAKI